MLFVAVAGSRVALGCVSLVTVAGYCMLMNAICRWAGRSLLCVTYYKVNCSVSIVNEKSF